MFNKQSYLVEDLIQRGQKRARALPQRLGIDAKQLGGKRVLEVGCGFGEHCAALEDIYGSEVTGIDPWPRINDGPFYRRQFYVQADITDIKPNSIPLVDYIASYDVLEHVVDPKTALKSIYDLLVPGGRAFLKYNLHRGASASHVRAETQIPWCHLIYSDDEIREIIKNRTGKAKDPAWVNKATYAHYLLWIEEIGFKLLKHWYIRYPLDDDFFETYRKKLEPYPKDDLEKNFMCVVIQK